jgi:hypothetical protein
MTVSNQTKKVTGTGNDSATVFSFSPMVLPTDSTQLVVVHTDADGVETTLSEGTGASAYAVTVTSYPGTGSITYPEDEVTPLPTGEFVTMKRVLTLEQQTDLENQGGYFPEVQETQFDLLLMIDLQQQEVLDRSFAFPVTYTGGASAEIPTPTALTYLRWNTAGDALENAALNAIGTAVASDATPGGVSLSAGASGTSDDYSRADHVHLLPTVSVAKGGTGSTTAAAAVIALGAPSLTTVNSFTKTQSWVKGADIASATTLVLGTDGNFFDVTGTTAITGITVAAGTLFMLQFDGVLTFTDGASLTLPTNANITTAAGDVAICFATAANTVTVLHYSRTSGAGLAAHPSGVVQQVISQDGAVATGTTTMPDDDTIPQITEGNEFMTVAITPKSSSNILVIEVEAVASYNGIDNLTLGLFQDSTANAIASVLDYQSTSTQPKTIGARYRMTAGTTSATTFKVRIGASAAGTVTFNGLGAGRLLGGNIASHIMVTEYAA